MLDLLLELEWYMKENKEKIGYYSVIPATVLYNKELKANEKLLYAIITSLACKEGYCFASNKYLAEKLNVNPKTVSSWISDLRDKDFIIVELIRNGNNQIIQRKIYINDSPYPLNNGYQYQSKNGQAIHQKVEDNVIRNNIKNNNGAIPGIRPGKPTSTYISKIIGKIAMIGALFLGIIAVFPIVFNAVFQIPVALGGTSIIIVVGVALETVKALESQTLMRHYKGFVE